MKSFKIFRRSKQVLQFGNIYRSTRWRSFSARASSLPFIVNREILPVEQENSQFVQQLIRRVEV
jgi:hypothetical protein